MRICTFVMVLVMSSSLAMADLKLSCKEVRKKALVDFSQQLAQHQGPWKDEADSNVWILGDERIQLITVTDPCLPTGTATFAVDAFLLVHAATGTVVKQVVDGHYSYCEYGPVDLQIKPQTGNTSVVNVTRREHCEEAGAKTRSYLVNQSTGEISSRN